MNRHTHLSRRSILKAIGGLAISSPLARALAQEASATDNGPLPKLILIAAEHAGSTYWWRPQGSENNFSLDFPGSVLAALAPLKSKLLVINGVGNYVAARDITGGVEGHECRAVTFTAKANSLPGEPNKARGPSIDQLIISQLRETRPLHASIGGYGGTGSEYYFSALGQSIPGVYTPRGIFDALFADVPPSDSPSDASSKAIQDFSRTLLSDQVRDANILRNRLGSSARAKLDQYLATIQDRIRALDMSTPSTISIPPRPSLDPNYGKPLAPNGPLSRINLEVDLIADGIGLGLTHVACLRIDHSVFENYYLGQTLPTYDSSGHATGDRVISDSHQHVSHAPIWGDQYRDLAPNLMTRDIQRAQAMVVARLLTRLDSIREVDGSTALDNTLVVWTSQMSDTISHGGGRLPYVLAGGLGTKMGTFRMGRYLDFIGSNNNNRDSAWAINTVVPSNVLLNSVLKTFGINLETFGDTPDAKCRGYLQRAI